MKILKPNTVESFHVASCSGCGYFFNRDEDIYHIESLRNDLYFCDGCYSKLKREMGWDVKK